MKRHIPHSSGPGSPGIKREEVLSSDTELFSSQYATGEVSGQLDSTLGRLHAYYQEEGSRKLHGFSRWTPRAIYFGIMLMIAYRIIQFYTGYFNQVRDAGGF